MRWRIGNYVLVEEVGRGGMGEVWRAEHVFLDRDAAIKLVRPGAGSSSSGPEEVWARFEREARAIARLKSPHTVQLYDYGVAPDGNYYYVMELLEGCSLEELIDRSGPIGPARAIRLLLQICDSLEEAHRLEIVHRDIKPSNLMLCRHGLRDDFVKVLDFGLVKLRTDSVELTQDQVFGTPSYIAPEIAQQSEHPDHRVDLYALGCVAYWLLTGETVFSEKSAMSMVMAHAHDEPRPPSERTEASIPAALEALVLRCLAKEPGDRPASAGEIAGELAAIECAEPWTDQDAERWWAEVEPQKWRGGFSPPTSATRLSPLTYPAPPSVASIAVLPFENRDESDRDYFGDGIAEEIITDLSRLSKLLVISRNSSFSYRDPSVEPRRVCRELGVRYLVLGAVRRAGDRVRVHAHLVDGATGLELWAERYDRELTDLFAVQDEVSRRIVAALQLTLSGEEDQQIGKRGTSDLEAYDEFLRGRDAMMRLTASGCETARHHFFDAARRDPDFCGAWCGLAATGAFEYSRRFAADPAATLAEAREHADRALATDPDEPLAHITSGMVAMWSGDLDRAIAAARRALELDPNTTEGRLLLQNCLHLAGRHEEALDNLHEVIERDPYFPLPVFLYLGRVYFALGSYNEAASCLRRRLAQDPEAHDARRLLIATLGHLGATAEAVEEYRLLDETNLDYERQTVRYRDGDFWERVDAGFRAAGLPPT